VTMSSALTARWVQWPSASSTRPNKAWMRPHSRYLRCRQPSSWQARRVPCSGLRLRPIVPCFSLGQCASIGRAIRREAGRTDQTLRGQRPPGADAPGPYAGTPRRIGGVESSYHSKNRGRKREHPADDGPADSEGVAVFLGESAGKTLIRADWMRT